MKYSIEDYGIDHDQYFPGVGVAYTEWDAVYTGIGETLREAIDDAIEMAAQSMDAAEFATVNAAIEAAESPFSADELDAPLHDPTDECQSDDEACEHHHYAALFVAGRVGANQT